MVESGTRLLAGLPPLLERADAQRLLECLAVQQRRPRWRIWIPEGSSDRARVEALLAIVNDDVQSRVSAERKRALRAFLVERVVVRERAARLFGAGEKLPHRTPALSVAAEELPPMLNDRVRASLRFVNADAGKMVARFKDPKGNVISVPSEGVGGVLRRIEHLEWDSLATALNYALAVVLDRGQDLGANLCRCHADECKRLWLLPEKLEGKPSRNYCPRHIGDRERLASTERKRRQRAE